MSRLSAYSLMSAVLALFFVLEAKAVIPAQNKRRFASTEAHQAELRRLEEMTAEQRAEYERRLQSFRDDETRITKAVQEAEAEYERARRAWENSRRRVGVGGYGFNFGDGLPEMRREMEEAQAAMNAAKSEQAAIRANAARVRETGEAIDNLLSQTTQANADMQAQLQVMRVALQNGRLQDRYSEMEQFFDNHDDRLNVIEGFYDNAVIGAYVQDKIAQLVNSQTMCRAFNRCKVNDPVKIPDAEIRDELFPTSTATRKSSYDHVKSRRSQ